MVPRARTFVIVLAAGTTLGGVSALAQTRPGLPTSFTNDARPLTDTPVRRATPVGAPVLRGTVDADAPAQRPRRGQANFVRDPPRNPEARVRRPVQGTVQAPQLVLTPPQRPVYDARASSLPSAGTPDPGPAPRLRRRAADDPYAPLGLRAGSFVLRPTLEAGIGTTDNVNASSTGRISSAYSRLAAGLRVDSDWQRHALTARARVDRQDYRASAAEERTTIDSGVDLRLDASRTTQFDVGASYRRAPDSATTFDLPVQAVGRPDLDTLTATAGVSQGIGRMQVRLRGQYDRLRYSDTQLADGTSISNQARDSDVSTVTLRAGYEVSPSLQPFVEAAYNTRDFVVGVDPNNRLQGSDGGVVRAGVAVDLGPKLRGELSAGYIRQNPRDPLADTVEGLAVDGALAWSVSPLTTVRGAVRTSVLDSSNTGVAGSTGGLARDLTLVVEHALRRNLLLTGTLGYGVDTYTGVERTDRRLTTGFGALWRFNRTLAWRIQATHQQLTSTVPGNDLRVSTIETVLQVEF